MEVKIANLEAEVQEFKEKLKKERKEAKKSDKASVALVQVQAALDAERGKVTQLELEKLKLKDEVKESMLRRHT
jgi:hypothetical protein